MRGGVFKILSTFWLLVGLLFSTMGVASASPGPANRVMVIPVTGMIDRGLANFVVRGLDTAAAQGYRAVVVEINTPGGLIDQAIVIRDAILRAPLLTIGFVAGGEGATSAGAMVALACEKLAMGPATIIGAAEPRTLNNTKADPKAVSFWSEQLAATAEARGRDPELARAMADASVRGQLLTLSAQDALKLKVADAVLDTRAQVLSHYGLSGAEVENLAPNLGEKVTRWATNPYVAPTLLAVGIGAVIIEVLTAGFGLAGTIGIIALALYFGGHLAAGYAGWGALALLGAGLILILLEAFVIPGFGTAGVGGIVALAASIIMASPSWSAGAGYLLIALVGGAAGIWLSLKFLPTRRAWSRLILKTSLEKKGGFVAVDYEPQNLLGQEGVAMSTLRPAGIAEIAGQRWDVVAEGAFIRRGSPVQVIKVEGPRIVVREMKSSIGKGEG